MNVRRPRHTAVDRLRRSSSSPGAAEILALRVMIGPVRVSSKTILQHSADDIEP